MARRQGQMTRRIVVPLDGSAQAERALGPAQTLAVRLGAEVELVRSTWEVPPTPVPAYLDEVASTMTTARVSTEMAPAMFAAPAITAALDGNPSSVVCMTTRGHTPMGAAILGSVAQEVLEAVSNPVLLIGPDCADPMPEIAGATAVVCFDGSEASASIASVVTEWAGALDLRLRLVTVLHNQGKLVGGREAGPTRERAESLAGRLRDGGVDVRLEFLEGLDPARTIVDYAANEHAGLIATATHGNRVTQAFLGSVAMWVVRRSPCPVLVHRPA